MPLLPAPPTPSCGDGHSPGCQHQGAEVDTTQEVLPKVSRVTAGWGETDLRLAPFGSLSCLTWPKGFYRGDLGLPRPDQACLLWSAVAYQGCGTPSSVLLQGQT